MKIQESKEDYLETIYILKAKLGFVRSIDVAAELGYSKPSISRAMSILKNDGLVIIEANGNIQLTELGLEQAKKVYERHTVITQFLTENLGVNNQTAEEDACHIEHVISEETFNKIKTLVKKS